MSNPSSTQLHINQRYLLQSKIGQGGMGIVYRAHDRLTRQTVALKQVKVPAASLEFANSQSGSTLTVALALEFRMLAGLRHPNIVSVLDYGFDERGFPYYTMPLLEGAQTLTNYTFQRDQASKVQLLIDMLEALVYLHRRDIIHRDLKPDNVLVTQEGVVKVMDFGLALQRDAPGQLDSGFAGTLNYMAPELFTGSPASIASDLYAFGLIAYQTLTSEEIFLDRTVLLSVKYRAPKLDLSALPLDLTAVIWRLLHPDSGERPPSAEATIQALCSATTTPPPAETPALRESFLQASTFVGRKAELTTLETALEGSFQGQGEFWLIGGESGVGKSRLLDELRTRALVRGALVLRGGAVADGSLPYHSWRSVVRRLVLETDLTDFEAGILKPLVPDIAALLERDIPDAPELLGTANQERLILALIDLFGRPMHHPVPAVVLLLEDLQWADQSLILIRRMLTLRDQLPHLLLIGTYRDEERPDLPEELTGIQVMKLPRLNDEAVATLAESMLGSAGKQPELIALLARETEGNAFFLVEVVRALAEEAGRLDQVGQTTPLPEQLRAGGVERVVRSRIARVPQWGQPMLQVAAAIGRQIDLTALDFIAERSADLLAGHALDEWLLVCAAINVFEVQDDQWRFSHDRIRGQVVDDIDSMRVPVVHHQIAEALEAAHGDDPSWANVLYAHWSQANDADKTLYYLDKVVEWMTWYSGEYVEARELILRGLDLLPETDARRLNLLNHLSEGYWRTGQFPEAAQVSEKARQLGLMLNVPQDVARSYGNRGIICRLQGQYDQAHDYLMESLHLRESIGDELGIARSYANLGINAYNQGQHKTAQDYYQRSIAI